MVIDTSAIIAILLREPEARVFAECIEADPVRLISAGNWLETQMVLAGRFGQQGAMIADSLLRDLRVHIVSLDVPHAHAALRAWQRFGKGRHAAALNLGDCCAYATAELSGEKLLFKGNDFAQTDLVSAI